MSEKRLKVLMVLPTFDICGGVESYVLNYMRRLRDRVDFDIIAHGEAAPSYVEEVQTYGGEVTMLPYGLLSRPMKIRKTLDGYFASHSYDVVHCNMPNGAWYYLSAAKRAGVPVRVMHAHQTKYADKFTHAVRNFPLIKLGKGKANAHVACSKLAGDFLFEKKPYDLIKNAIDMDRFIADHESHERLKNELGISGSPVIIHVGRFCNQKNQPFVLEVFKQIKKEKENAKLIFLGDGEQKSDIEKMTRELGLSDSVIFPGTVDNTEMWLRASDVFLLPSLYEGLPLSGLEAQAAGLPCIVADTVTKELDLTGLVRFLSLSEPCEGWARTVLDCVEEEKLSAGTIRERFASAGYDIRREATHLLTVYERLVSGK